MRRLALALGFLAALSTACLNGDASARPDAGPGTDAGPPACTTGETRACTCQDGASGEQGCAGGAWAECACAGACTASSLTAQGALTVGGGSIDYSGAAVTTVARHKLDVDVAADGCISHAEFTLQRPGGGCTLVLVFGAYQGAYGGLVEVRLDADSYCPGFPDADEGLYTSEPAYGTAWFSGPAAVPEHQASSACMEGVTIRFPAGPIRLVRADGARERTVDLSGLSFAGDWFSEGDTAEACVDLACAPGLHDGGTGWCISTPECAAGYRDGGDGSCVPEGTCASGYHDGGDGACVAEGSCASGHHDGGDGSCLPEGTCADGYRLGADGLCAAVRPCGDGLVVSDARLEFGSVRVGESAHLSFGVTNPAALDACTVPGLGLIAGADAGFSLPGGSWTDVSLAPGETRSVEVVFAPVALAIAAGVVRIDEGDAAGTLVLVRLTGRGTDVDLRLDPASLDFGTRGLACGDAVSTICAVNDGTSAFTVSSIGASGSTDLDLVHQPGLPATVDPGAQLCTDVRYAPSDAGMDRGAVAFSLASGDVFSASLNGAAVAAPTRTESFVQQPAPKADILWVVDNSGSMSEEQATLSSNATAIVTELEQGGIDYQLGVVSTDPAEGAALRTAGTSTTAIVHPGLADPAGTFAQNVMLGTAGSGTEHGFEVAYEALSQAGAGGVNAGFVRTGAKLAIVFVSDEDDQSVNLPDFYVNLFLNFQGLGNCIVSAIVTPVGGCDTGTSPGTRYIDMANRTGGTVVSICDTDWLPPIRQLVSSLGLQSTFVLSGTLDPASLQVTVTRTDGTSYVPAGWTFDASTNAVVFSGDVPQPGETIVVTYVEAC